MAVPEEISYRETIGPDDEASIRRIVGATKYFSEDEIDLAAELARERLEKDLASGYHFIFAERGGIVLGYTCFGPIPVTSSSYDLYWIAVHPDAQGAGLGKVLIVRTEERIRDLGGTRIYIETSGLDLYRPTRSFYLRCGYMEAAVLPDFYAPGDSKYIYVKQIQP